MTKLSASDFRNLSIEEMTQAERDRYNLEMWHWDLYRDVNGSRPRWVKYADMSDKELSDWCDRLEAELKEEFDRKQKERDELEVARKHGYVWLSSYGEMCKEFDGKVDPNDPECWNYAMPPASAPAVTLADAFKALGF